MVCTAELLHALRWEEWAELRERFLPPLFLKDRDRAQREAQFLTEEHGGWRWLQPDAGRGNRRGMALEREKRFCSVADADRRVVTRPPLGRRSRRCAGSAASSSPTGKRAGQRLRDPEESWKGAHDVLALQGATSSATARSSPSSSAGEA
ncbi:MAG: hypothetical protein C4306_01120, partial [Thermoleophilia bacterium]